MSDETATMPDSDTMFDALCSVHDDGHARKHLYPKICEQLAGTEADASNVVLVLQESIQDYIEELPSVMEEIMYRPMASFIKAIVPEKIRQEALDFWISVFEDRDED